MLLINFPRRMKHYTCGSTDKGVTYFNYLDFEISSVIAIIIIILSAIDYTQKRNNKGGIAISVILLIIGLIMLFLYNSIIHMVPH